MKNNTLKIVALSAAFLFAIFSTNAQVGVGTTTPHSSAELDVSSTNTGVLIPRMTTGQRLGIGGPATGLMVYDIVTGSFWYYNGAAWAEIGEGTDMITDADNDTKIQVEENADEDIIRFDIANSEAMRLMENNNGDHRLEFPSNFADIFIGGSSGLNADGSANYSTAMGYRALEDNYSGNYNTAIGAFSMYVKDSFSGNNTALGYASLSNVESNGNTAVGYFSLFDNTTGSDNTAVGSQSLANATTGSDNTAMGANALDVSTTASNNSAFGSGALGAATTGFANSAMGNLSLDAVTTGFGHTAIGYGTSSNISTGFYTTAVGYNVLTNSTGSWNTGVGSFALDAVTTGTLNSALGYGALGGVTTGGSNVAVGYLAGDAITTGSSNTAIGHNADVGAAVSNATAIGTGALATSSNTVILGTASTNVGIGTSAPFYKLDVNGDVRTTGDFVVTGGGQLDFGSVEYIQDGGSFEIEAQGDIRPSNDNSYDLGTATFRWDDVYATNGTIQTSDRRDKTNIQDLKYGLTELMQLRPVSYEWKEKPEAGQKLGLIAQELQEVVSEVVKTHDWEYNEETGEKTLVENDRLGVYYSDLIPVLIKATQEQQALIEKLSEKNEELVQRLEALEGQN